MEVGPNLLSIIDQLVSEQWGASMMGVRGRVLRIVYYHVTILNKWVILYLESIEELRMARWD